MNWLHRLWLYIDFRLAVWRSDRVLAKWHRERDRQARRRGNV